MVMKGHKRIEQLLSAYRSLNENEWREVKQHITECAPCAQRLAAYQAMDEQLMALPIPAVAVGARGRFFNTLAAEKQPHTPHRLAAGAWWRSFSGLLNQAAPVILLIVVAAGLSLAIRQRAEAPAPSEAVIQAGSPAAVKPNPESPHDAIGKPPSSVGAAPQALAVISPTVTMTADSHIYIVQPGDTLFTIAAKLLGDGHRYPEIVASTSMMHAGDPSFAVLADLDRLEIGAKLWIPETSPAPANPATPAVTPASGEPAGQIAFAFWNASSNRCTYEINIIEVSACLQGSQACQNNRRIFALNNVSEPALSPAGNRIAFRGWGEPRDDKSPYLHCAAPVKVRYLANTTLDGTDLIGKPGFWEDSHPDWSPDAQRIIFDTARLGDRVHRIMLMNADGTNEVDPYLIGQQPAWGPDGQRFIYRGCDASGNRCGLWTANAVEAKPWDGGKNMIAPVVLDDRAAHPDWSPAADKVVYQSTEAGGWDLFIINLDGSGKQRLTSDAAIEGLPRWSPDGQWIAYLSNSGGNWGIWIIRADGSGQRQLFAFDGGGFSPAPVEPYGQRDWLDEQISWSH
jgi:Tol biopolymer transport system component